MCGCDTYASHRRNAGDGVPYWLHLSLIQRLPRLVALGLVGDGADGLALHTVFGVVAEEVDVSFQVGALGLHGFHHRHGGDDIVDGAVGVDHLAGEPIGLDGAAELVGEFPAIPVDGEQVELVLALENSGVAVPEQHVEQEAQVKMGVVGQQQGVARDELGDVPADPSLGDALLPQVLGGDAGELLDLRGHEAAGAQIHKLVVFLNDPVAADALFHSHGGELDDLVPAVVQAGGLRVQDHQTVVPFKQFIKGHYFFAPSSRERWNLDLVSASSS